MKSKKLIEAGGANRHGAPATRGGRVPADEIALLLRTRRGYTALAPGPFKASGGLVHRLP